MHHHFQSSAFFGDGCGVQAAESITCTQYLYRQVAGNEAGASDLLHGPALGEVGAAQGAHRTHVHTHVASSFWKVAAILGNYV